MNEIAMDDGVPQPAYIGQLMGGMQARWHFPNGYGASVVNTPMSYGTELAVLHGSAEDWDLIYDTPVTADVIGWIDSPEILAGYLKQIEALPPRRKEIENA
jgi:hypothetical protein